MERNIPLGTYFLLHNIMKFGEKLRSEMVPEWSGLYLDYDKLKNMIKELEAYHLYDTQITDKGCR